ncbi:MAG: cobalamin-dependent protein [Magnetococcales bacterium]|nr:cobalamin-dependent protein [Magnetococcales bacterium]
MRILLVIVQETSMKTYQISLGVGYVSASLKRAGHDVHVLNPNHSNEPLKTQLLQSIKEFQPQMLGVGGMSFHMRQIREIVVTARPMLPHGVIVVGGVAMFNHPEVTMSAIPEADIGVVGEGEYTTVELVEALESGKDLKTVNGLIYWEVGRKLIQTAPRPIETELDKLPWIDWEGIGLEVYSGLHNPGELIPGLIVEPGARVLPFLTSRGCPFSCTFCCHEITGRRYRTRSMDDVFKELEYLIDRFKINTVSIYDDIFCLKPQNLRDFCERIRPLNLRWKCSLRVEQVTAENLKIMKESGCVTISFGIESMSPTVLDSMKKSTNFEALANALDLMYESKITTFANLIFGDPAETMETSLESLEWWAKNNHFDLRTDFIGYNPGTTIYEDALAKGLIKDPLEFIMSGNSQINATTMTDQEYETLRTEIVPHYIQAFGFPGRILELSQTSTGSFNMRSICPHCKKELMFKGFTFKAGIINRISCKYCNQLHRIPIRFRAYATKELKQLNDKLSAVLQSNNNSVPVALISEVFEICQAVVNIDMGHDLAWSIMVSLLDHLNREESAINTLKLAINGNPYNQDLFYQMEARLKKLGRDDELTKYNRQAKLLSSLGITAPFDIELAPG